MEKSNNSIILDEEIENAVVGISNIIKQCKNKMTQNDFNYIARDIMKS